MSLGSIFVAAVLCLVVLPVCPVLASFQFVLYSDYGCLDSVLVLTFTTDLPLPNPYTACTSLNGSPTLVTLRRTSSSEYDIELTLWDQGSSNTGCSGSAGYPVALTLSGTQLPPKVCVAHVVVEPQLGESGVLYSDFDFSQLGMAAPGGLSPGAIAGIVIGVLAVLTVLVGLGWYFLRYRPSQRLEATSAAPAPAMQVVIAQPPSYGSA